METLVETARCLKTPLGNPIFVMRQDRASADTADGNETEQEITGSRGSSGTFLGALSIAIAPLLLILRDEVEVNTLRFPTDDEHCVASQHFHPLHKRVR